MPAKRYPMPNENSIVPARTTEGMRPGQTALPSQARRPRGRPKGSTNKPKGILPKELASTILLELKDQLPPEHFEYMRGVIKDGKAISVERELDTMILLLGRNLYPALVMEGKPKPKEKDFFAEEGESVGGSESEEPELVMPEFRKDVTERLKVWAGLLAQKDKMDRGNKDDKPNTVFTIAAGRGIDPERIRLLVGVEPGSLVGNVDQAGQPANAPRTVSDQVPQRPELLPAGEQDEADRI